MVAEGTTSVNGRISSMKDTYFKLGVVESYMAIIKMVWVGAHARSKPSPTTGKRYEDDPTKSMSRLKNNLDHMPRGKICLQTLTGVGRGPVS
eukprot:CAMPEP_0178868428 /NCGR_PEP_ID=MMETSP0747-20121128/5980_1 /TAXON_ID=913974 /ORGANISM="Nitzschia punctata, Strain CCMP561" /LENGTH=91 /DNA_ID=CAMNT_0020535365 /DNA_START=250 /DNA_END=525 /DNA_ORIENTATION=-